MIFLRSVQVHGLSSPSSAVAPVAPPAGATGGLGFNDRLDASRSDRLHERLVITLGLIGIVARKVADRLVKGAA